jgi:hypothetical protein
MTKRASRNLSGQTLIIAALIIVLMMLSTSYYILEVERSTTATQPVTTLILPVVKLCTRNAAISALANISNGGTNEVLYADMKSLSQALERNFYLGKCNLNFVLSNSTPYVNGTWISWGDNGEGISSADTTFRVNFTTPSANFYSEYETTVTTALTIQGTFTSNDYYRNANVTCTLYNDEAPAAANRVSLYYQNETEGPWTIVGATNNLSCVDYGNGTYFFSFTIISQDPPRISAQVLDTRGIIVAANNTCTEI